MDRWKAELGRGREKRRVEESRSEKRKSQKKEDADARKGRKVAKHCVFPMICGSGGSKSRLAKPAGAEPSGQMRDEKVHAVVPRSTFRSQNVQNSSDVVSRGRRKWLCTLSKVSKTWGFCRIPKNHGRRGTFEEDLQRCIFCGRRSTKDMFMRDVRRSGRWFPERGCILEHQICRFAKMILHDRWSTSYDLASVFRGRCSTLDRWSEAVSAALNFPFFKEVSQNCLKYVVKFKNWRSLAELLRFGCCQVQKLQTSRRIVSFLMLSTSKNEEVSQNCLVFKLADRQVDRQTDRQTTDGRTDRQTEREREKDR